LFEENPEPAAAALSRKTDDEPLPWSVIETGTTSSFLKNERERSNRQILTSPCMEKCTVACGICNDSAKTVQNSIQGEVRIPGCVFSLRETFPKPVPLTSSLSRILFSFRKTGPAVFIPHLGVIEVFSMAFMRAGDLLEKQTGLKSSFTQGFNPHLCLGFASPAAVGLVCEGEIASIDCDTMDESKFFKDRGFAPEEFCAILNDVLPMGFRVLYAKRFTIFRGEKKHTLSSLLHGFRYGNVFVPAGMEKQYRQEHSGECFLTRSETLAKKTGTDCTDSTGIDYFSAYRELYG
jgi:hypothetical protein